MKSATIIVHMTTKQRNNLKKKAAELGFKAKGGPNVSGFMRAIADGEVKAVFTDGPPPDIKWTPEFEEEMRGKRKGKKQ